MPTVKRPSALYQRWLRELEEDLALKDLPIRQVKDLHSIPQGRAEFQGKGIDCVEAMERNETRFRRGPGRRRR